MHVHLGIWLQRVKSHISLEFIANLHSNIFIVLWTLSAVWLFYLRGGESS
jgi:hypothetical protein